jgi:hypothetical protein
MQMVCAVGADFVMRLLFRSEDRVEAMPNLSCCAALYVASFGRSVSQWRVSNVRLKSVVVSPRHRR